MSETTQEFGKWRSRLWPIHKFELKKVLPMVAMVFLVLFLYTILRDLKDSMVVTNCGAGAIVFLKVAGTVPVAILFMVLYTKFSNILTKKQLFYASIVPFVVFFGAFATVIYPNAHALEPTALVGWLQTHLPANWMEISEIVRHWPFAAFYVMAEMWGTVALSLLFWGFANQISGSSEAKRIYPIFGMFGNLSLIASGELITRLAHVGNVAGVSREVAFGHSLHYFMGMVVVGAGIIMGLYWWLNKYVLSDPKYLPAENDKRKKKAKPKMGFFASLKYLASSKYILCLAIVVMSYGIAINLIEVMWKGQLKIFFEGNIQGYTHFMGRFSQCTGILTILTMFFLSGNVIRKFGWKSAALFTPIMMAVTSAVFFAFILLTGMNVDLTWLAAMGATPVFMAVALGFVQNIFSKSSKYAFFDPTKEMAYIPLDDEQKVKGKAAIDVVGARLGKSGGSAIQIVLMGAVGFASMAPYVAVIVGGVLFAWITAAGTLAKLYNKLTDQREAEAAEDKAADAAQPVAG